MKTKIKDNIQASTSLLSLIKNRIVYRLFWGRGNLYKKLLHSIFILLTLLILVTGINSRISSISAENSLSTGLEQGNLDILEQGGSIQSVLLTSPKTNFKVATHVVTSSDTLDSLVSTYKVSKESIIWSNEGKIDYWTQKLKVGDTLLIPELNGIVYTVKQNDTLDSILDRAQGEDRTTVVEVNGLYKSDDQVIAQSQILIPNATFPAPKKPLPQPNYVFQAPTSKEFLSNDVVVSKLSGISFVDPLSHPKCSGYKWMRGYFKNKNGSHDAVDLSKSGGCPIRAAAAGTVTFTGWGNYGEGYHVRIDHGNGITTVYFHGDGNMWVKAGDKVYAGQEIMNMGCTGNCSGTHLHFGLRINKIYIDPAPYVPYNRPF